MGINLDRLVSSTSNWQRQRFHSLLLTACGGDGGDDGGSAGAGGECRMSSLCPVRKLCDLLTRCQCEHVAGGLTCLVAIPLPTILIVDYVNRGKLIRSVIVLFVFCFFSISLGDKLPHCSLIKVPLIKLRSFRTRAESFHHSVMQNRLFSWESLMLWARRQSKYVLY